MKILYLQNGMHHKNQHALTEYKNIQLYEINMPDDLDYINLTEFDCVYSPATPINASKYPATKFIFGPHFSIFPVENQIQMVKSKNAVYNLLSDWVVNIWKQYSYCDGLNIVTVPFGVDTTRFNEGSQSPQNKTEIIIYYKNRNPSELQFVIDKLNKLSIKFSVFSYKQRYDENDYIDYLKRAKYCIWIDAHESQGFALQEALSCNVPLLVWNISSMNQEYGQNYNKIPATTIPYWDKRCGEFFYKSEDFTKTFEMFLSKLDTYKPREFILENLSEDVCEAKFINTINGITI
jgi:hypothetical protein